MTSYRSTRAGRRELLCFVIGALLLCLIGGHEEWPSEAGQWQSAAVMRPTRRQAKEAKVYTGTVESVHDGDTLWVNVGTQTNKLRLWHCDAPESNQPYGAVAQAFTEKFALAKTVAVTEHGNSYGRPVVEVLVDGKSLNAALVAAGLAWVDIRYGKPKDLLALQAQAQADKRGLWADPLPIPPWVWRKTPHK